MRLSLLLVAAASLAGMGLYAGDASACGGCFHPPAEQESVITDHRMIFSVTPAQSTLYDQIHFQGNPQEFAWVLPIAGTVDVGLSADSVFSALDNLTAVGVNPPSPNCPGPPASCFSDVFAAPETNATAGAAADVDAGVTVLKTQVVGPYETVQLHPTSNTDVGALEDYLTSHGFNITDDVKPIIAEYVKENFNFLALRLQPGQGVDSMRPVRVTTQGANVALPLRMVAAGTGATVGIELWVISGGRYQPTNFASFAILETDITWDWTSNSSDYTTLRAQHEAAQPNSWEIESVIQTSAMSLTQSAQSASFQNAEFGDAGTSYDNDYLPVASDAGTTENVDQVQDDDYNALVGGPDMRTADLTITRMRADVAHTALNVDLTVGAASDQSLIAPLRNITKESGQPLCPVYNQCTATGQTLPRDQVPSSSSGGPASSGDGGCRTTPSSGSKAPASLGLGLLALAAGRAIRKRRRSSASK